MQLTRRQILALGGAAGATALLGIPARAQKRGGDAIVGTVSAPPLTDAHASTAEVSRSVSLHWIETLWARDENGNAIPDLAQKTDISPDGKVYTFTLRQGVAFHNGQEMTAQDVKASLERYREELIAANYSVPEIAKRIGVDSLGYLSLEGMLAAVPGGPGGFCHACFSGEYPTAPPSSAEKYQLVAAR